MSSLLQVASILAERAGKKSDMSFIKEMKDLAVIKRGRFVENSISKNPAMAKVYGNSFVINLKRVDPSDECAEDVEECDGILRTEFVIPPPIKYGVHPFDYVGAPDGSKSYGWTTFGNEPTLKFLPVTGKFARHTYLNNYVYIFNKNIDNVRVEGVWADQRQIAKFKSCNDNGKTCWSEENDFFIEEPIAELIIRDVLANELRLIPQNEKIIVKEDKNV